ncbi:MAG: Alkyl hydroperoxide reductase [Parcubacteria group bacterium GW2011_GWA2_44_15]|nr:MAG: Alkyl hydroperoxide reductase [Parcubacteria group bacterium GW2011_GWA2_44_15]
MIHDSTQYDLAIIGGGPAAVAAGVYASRKRLKTLFITKEFGGQSTVSTDIQNWIGTSSISGAKLAESLKEHLKAYAQDTVTIVEGVLAKNVEKTAIGFKVKTENDSYEAKTVLIATGSRRRRLGVPGADKFEHKGIVYCASCDGPLFAELDVIVIGGGNAGFETAAQLLAYAKSVVLLHRKEEFKADPVTVKKVLSNPKMHAVLNAEILEVKGEQFVETIVYKEKETGNKVELPAQGIFVEIGSVPSTELVAKLVERDQFGQIIVNPRSQRASITGIWAAGDCTDGLYHQNNIAAGDAVKALEDIYMYLHVK